MDFAERAARNEEVVRDVNERIEEGAELHGVDAAMPFHCECGQAPCLEKVDLAPSHPPSGRPRQGRFHQGRWSPRISSVSSKSSPKSSSLVDLTIWSNQAVNPGHPELTPL